jgi:cytochrome P450
MSLYPDVQSRAQAEIDAVLGVGPTGLERLPTLADRDRMPYVDAFVKEVLRWHPAVPLGLPHRLTQDDIYQGCVISAGTTVWPNIWYAIFSSASERMSKGDRKGA